MSNQSPEKDQANLTLYEKNFLEYIWNDLQKSNKQAALKEAVDRLSNNPGGPEFQQRLAMQILTIAISELRRQIKPQYKYLVDSIKLAFAHLPNFENASEDSEPSYPKAVSESSRQLLILIQYLEVLLPDDDLSAIKSNILYSLAQEPDSRANLISTIENESNFNKVQQAFDTYWEEHQQPNDSESLVVAARYFARVAEQKNLSELIKAWKLAKQLDKFSLPDFFKFVGKSLLRTNLKFIIWQLQLRQKFEGRDQTLNELVEELQKFTDLSSNKMGGDNK